MKKILSFAFVALMSGSIYAQQLNSAKLLVNPNKNQVTVNATTPINSTPVKAKKAAGTDLAVLKIDAPFSNCGLSSMETVIFTFRNAGTDKVANFNVGYRIGSGDTVLQMVTDSIAPGDTVQVTFAQLVDLSAVQSYNLRVFTFAPADTVTRTNNSLTATIVASRGVKMDKESLLQGFETTENTTGWLIENTNGNATWAFNNTQFPHSGKRTAVLFGNGAVNDWFFTKCLEMKAGTQYELSYYYRSNQNPENLEVYLVNAQKSTATKILVSSHLGFATFDHTLSLDTATVTEDGGYYLGFVSTNPTCDAILIDDIRFKSLSPSDAIVKEIFAPKSSCALPTSTPVKVTITNTGTTTLSNFKVFYKEGTKTPIQETFTGSILPNESADYTFSTILTLPAGNSFTFSSYTEFTKVGEEFATIVKRVATKSLATPLNQGFEEADDLDGWEFLDANNDGVRLNTGQINPSFTRQDGTGATKTDAISYNSANATENGDDWYFSKCFTLEKTRTYKYSLFYSPAPGAVNMDGQTFSTSIGLKQLPASMKQIDLLEALPPVDAAGTFEELTTNGYFVDSTATYYFGIHVTTPADNGSIVFDDFSISRDGVRGINASELFNAVSIYPNPVKNTLSVETDFGKIQDLNVKILDILGKVVFTGKYSVATDNIRIDVSSLTPGMYTISMNSNNDSMNQKFMVVE